LKKRGRQSSASLAEPPAKKKWPPSAQEDCEDDVIAEARHAVQGGHLDDEGEEVVDEGIERLVPGTCVSVCCARAW
jgi:hypothetical protein